MPEPNAVARVSRAYFTRFACCCFRCHLRTRVRRGADRVQIGRVQAQPEQHGEEIRTSGVRGRDKNGGRVQTVQTK